MTAIAPSAVFAQVLNGGDGRLAIDILLNPDTPVSDGLVLRAVTRNTSNGQVQTADYTMPTSAGLAGFHYIAIDSAFYDFFDIINAWYYNIEGNFGYSGSTPATLLALQILDHGQVIDTLGDPAGSTAVLPANTTLDRNGNFFAAPGQYNAADYTVSHSADYNRFDQFTLAVPHYDSNLSVVSVSVNGADHGTADTTSFQVVFSEAVTGVTTASFVISGPDSGAAVTAVHSADNRIWTVEVAGLERSGTYELALASGTAGISGTYAATFSAPQTAVADYSIDPTGPAFDTLVATSIGDADGLLNAGDVVTFRVTSSLAADPSADADVALTLSNGVTLHATAASLHAGTTELVFEYAIGQADAGVEDTGSLTVQSLAIVAGSLADGSSNPASFTIATGAPLGLAIDTVAPDAQLTGVTDGLGLPIAGGSALKAGQQIILTVQVAEALVGGTPLALELSNGQEAAFTGASTDGRTLTFGYTVAAGDDAASLSVLGLLSTARLADAAGNALVPLAATDLNIVIDTVKPALAITGVAPDLGVDDTDGITLAGAGLTLRGTAEAGSVVALTVSGPDGTHSLGAVTATDGTWSVDLGDALPPGSYTYAASTADQAGNLATASLPVTIVAAAVAPVVLGVGTALQGAGDLTALPAPAIFGTAAAGTTISVSVDGQSLGTVTAGEDGAWTMPADALAGTPLADGSHVISTTATDLAGLTEAGVPFAFAVDTTGPQVASLQVLASTGAHDTVLLAGDTIEIAVAFDEPIAALEGTLVLRLSNGAELSSTGLGADGRSVAFSYTVQQGDDIASLMADGLRAAPGASLVDALGNRSALALAPQDLGFEVHTARPALPSLALLDAEGHATTSMISATGQLAAAAGDVTSQLQYAVDGGAYTTGLPSFLQDGSQDGQHTVQLRAIDAYGLTSDAVSLAFTLDTRPPAVAITDAAVTARADGGSLIALSGTIETSAGIGLHLMDGAHDLGAAQLDGEGHWSFTVTLAAGEHTLHALATDAAGNVTATPDLPSLSGASITLPFNLADAPITGSGEQIALDLGGVHLSLSGLGHLQFADGSVDQDDGAPGVDDLFYYLANPDVWAAHMDPDEHYAQYGWKEGRDPNAFFSTSGYLAANPDVAALGGDPLAHYLEYGWKEGRDPSAHFDTALYLAANPDVLAAGADPLTHFLEFGAGEGRQVFAAVGTQITHGGFDAEYYLLANPDVAAGGMDAWTHFAQIGWKEGRDPNAFFDVDAYLAANPDVEAAGVNPLTHYDAFGWKEGRNPGAKFDTVFYEAHNPDVAAAAINPLVHFLGAGLGEGRAAMDEHGLLG